MLQQLPTHGQPCFLYTLPLSPTKLFSSKSQTSPNNSNCSLIHILTVSLNQVPMKSLHCTWLLFLLSLFYLSFSSSSSLLVSFLAIKLLEDIGHLWAVFWLGHLTYSSVPCVSCKLVVRSVSCSIF